MEQKSWRNYLSHDIGIDLGTANTLVYVRGRGVMIDEPSVVAYNKRSKQIIAIGKKAKEMVGKTPQHIVAARPLVDGVVSDFEITEQMLRYFIQRIHKENWVIWPRPRVVVGLPSGVTEVEKRAVESAARSAGARSIHLVEEPMAAAIGADMPVKEASGNIIIDIGGGTTEVAVISLGGIVLSRSLRVAGDEMNDAIIQLLRDEHNLHIGEQTAEKIKIAIGSVHPAAKSKDSMTVSGRDIVSGLPRQISLTAEQLRPTLLKQVRPIIHAIKITLEETPPELVADIMAQGIYLTGGGALLGGLKELISSETSMPVHVIDEPLIAVARGTGKVLEDLESLKEVLVTTNVQK